MTVVATYHLKHSCGHARPFCRPCTNSFKVTTCGPVDCDAEPPSVICLKPILPSCEECGTQRVVQLADFNHLFSPIAWYGDYTLLPYNDCCWRVEFTPIVQNTTVPDIYCDVASTIHAVLTTTGSLTLCVVPYGDDGWEWILTYRRTLTYVARDSMPNCYVGASETAIEAGDVLLVDDRSYRSPVAGGLGYSRVTQEPINCDDPFNIWLDSGLGNGSANTAMGISFIETE